MSCEMSVSYSYFCFHFSFHTYRISTTVICDFKMTIIQFVVVAVSVVRVSTLSSNWTFPSFCVYLHFFKLKFTTAFPIQMYKFLYFNLFYFVFLVFVWKRKNHPVPWTLYVWYMYNIYVVKVLLFVIITIFEYCKLL